MRELGIPGLGSHRGPANGQGASVFSSVKWGVMTNLLPVVWLWDAIMCAKGLWKTLTSYTKARGWHH